MSNNGGNIVLTYDESLPDSVQTSILVAKGLWESKLPMTQPIFISVSFEPLGDDISMICDVIYSATPDLMGCPCALASQISNSPWGSIDSPDGYVILNSDIDWNCRFSNDATSDYNLPTMVLRGIARCLGFGSSIVERSKDEFSYFLGSPTYFDKLLYCDGNALSNLPEKSSAMADFVKSNKVYAHTESQDYKIYAPDEFVQDLSLCYFDGENSIMSHSLGQGNIDLSIDDKTCDILRAIGWYLPLSGLSIKCDNISNNGIGSSYEPHTFSLLKGDKNISNYSWRFLLKDKQGNYTRISDGTGESFSIAEISSPDNYFVNVNGDLEGRIECDYTLEGKRYSAVSFMLSLELEPIFFSINDLTVVNSVPYGFYLTFTVRYTGADCVYVKVEEEYSTILRRYEFYEPYIAHVKTGNISNLYYSWVHVIVSNKYGTASETMEFAPVSGETDPDISLDIPDSHIVKIILYTMDGTLVFSGTPSEFENQTFKRGIYIKEVILDNGESRTSKVLFK